MKINRGLRNCGTELSTPTYTKWECRKKKKEKRKIFLKKPENILTIMKNILYNPVAEPIPSRINTRGSIHRHYIVIVKC